LAARISAKVIFCGRVMAPSSAIGLRVKPLQLAAVAARAHMIRVTGKPERGKVVPRRPNRTMHLTSSFFVETERFFRLATRSRFWRFCRDVYPAVIAAALPWSTTAVIVFLFLWIITLIPTIEPLNFLRTLRRPASLLPVIFFALAAIGILWADTSWSAAFHGLGPPAKLLILPLLLYQYEYLARSYQVFIAFLVSCALLLADSWLILFSRRRR
jgi:hypothetical protein